MATVTNNTGKNTTMIYNSVFIDLLDQLAAIMLKKGEPFRARAYQKAQETIMSYPNDITDISQLNGLPNIGATILEKFREYEKTGTLRVLEEEKNNPINILADVYGIGPKKAQELVKLGITTIDQLRAKQDELLNETQKVGLKYYEDVLKRIPREEIDEYDTLFRTHFPAGSKYEIVGSYRRGAMNSGDIDVIITGSTGKEYKAFIDVLIARGVIVEVLSRGPSKTLVITRLPGETRVNRRVDFLYASPAEFPFSILYFTGSKIFNTLMRQRALDMGYTLNEHGMHHMANKIKGEKADHVFETEQDIFEFLKMEYREPRERIDGRSIKKTEEVDLVLDMEIEIEAAKPVKKPKKTTLKKKIKTQQVDTGTSVVSNIIAQFKEKGIAFLDQQTESDIETVIRYANKMYTNKTPVLTDVQYDIIKEYMEGKYPANAVINEVGAPIERDQTKVNLPYSMPSMNKIKPDTDVLTKWAQKYSGPYNISCKLDGVSGMYSTMGQRPSLYTRGDGMVGQDISYLIPHLKLPRRRNLVIRGEFIIPKSIFDSKYAVEFKNPRNMVAGLINSKEIRPAISDLHFVAYEVIEPQMKPIEQFALLKTLSESHNEVACVFNKSCNSITNETLSQMLVQLRAAYEYEIDGLIVTNDGIYPRQNKNPEHAFAFKMVLTDQEAEVKVLDVLWAPSKDGYLKPRVQIEPVRLGGVDIQFATGNNAGFIRNGRIGVGAIVKIIRSGDVIPKIVEVLVPADQPKLPVDVPYVWNATNVDIVVVNPEDNPIVKARNITGFFTGLEVEGLGSGNITKLIEAGYDSVPAIIRMEEADFLKVPGFKEKMAHKLYTGIHSKIDNASLIQLMAVSNTFGRGFSHKRLELIMRELPDVLVSAETYAEKVIAVENIKGMGETTARLFADGIDAFKKFIIDAGLEEKLYETAALAPVVVNPEHPLFNKTVVLTGTRDKSVIDLINKVGANMGANVSKNTFLVIAKSKMDDTGKALEAKKLGINIVTPEEFMQMYACY